MLTALILGSLVQPTYQDVSIFRSTTYKNEVRVLSFAKFNLSEEAKWISNAFLYSSMADDSNVSGRECTFSFAVAHYHLYSRRVRSRSHESQKFTCTVPDNSKFIVPDVGAFPNLFASPYMKFLRPFASFNGNTKQECRWLEWSQTLGVVMCPIAKADGLCAVAEHERIRAIITGEFAPHEIDPKNYTQPPPNDVPRCPNHLEMAVETAPVGPRRRLGVELSSCLYSGTRNPPGSILSDILEDNIEYHRRRGFTRFYVLDRQTRHADLIAKHRTDWVDTSLVRYYGHSPLESINPDYMSWWRTFSQKRGQTSHNQQVFKSDTVDHIDAMALCTHEHPYDHWQFQIDKDEFLACSSPDVRDTDVLMVRIICLFSSHSVISLLYINPFLFLPSSPLRRIYCGLIQTPLGIGPKKLKQRSFSTRYCVGLVVTCRLSVQQI